MFLGLEVVVVLDLLDVAWEKQDLNEESCQCFEPRASCEGRI